MSDARLAAFLASGAGDVLNALRAQVDGGTFPGGMDELRAAGDAAAQAYIAAALTEARPRDAVLSEEAIDDAARLAADRVWIVDPLDGTREFAERHEAGWRDDFAVHVALWCRGAGLTDGAVALPGRGLVLQSAAPVQPTDATVLDVLARRRPLRLAASRSRPPAIVDRLAARDDVELVPMGSTGAKVAAVLEGAVDAYVHAGGQYEWDSAAPVAVAGAAGFVATRLDGSALIYNKEDTWSPDLVVCHPALEGHLRAMLEAVSADDDRGAGA